MKKALGELIEDRDVTIEWEFISHDEREELLDKAYEVVVSEIKEIEQVDQGGSIEYMYNAYIEDVEAYITIKYYGSWQRDLAWI